MRAKRRRKHEAVLVAFVILDDPFNYWSAVKYGSVLMFLLWWIPIFGPMIAGYVAGRRAGTPLKGVFAVSIPLAVVFFVATLVTIKIIPTVWFGVDLAPDAIFGALASAAPVFGPFANFTTGYLESFIGDDSGHRRHPPRLLYPRDRLRLYRRGHGPTVVARDGIFSQARRGPRNACTCRRP